MSNRNYLLPSINPLSNPTFKGDVLVEGDLQVDGVTRTAGIVNTGLIRTTTLEITDATSPYRKEQITLFVPTIVSATAALCVVTSRLAGTITAISVVGNAQPTVGSATFTSSINGVAITAGAPALTTATAAGTAVSVTPTGANTLAVGDVISVLVGGANTAAGTAHVSFQIITAAS